jgi:hypothetical protein
MKLAQKASLAALSGIVVVMLAGCVSGPSEGSQAAADSGTTSAAPTTQTQPEQRRVRALKVIDPVTIIMTPADKTDTLYGKDFTVHVNDILTPAKGQCGYDQALALANSTLIGTGWVLQYGTVTDGVYIDSDGDHHGYLDSNRLPYGKVMLNAGMAYVPDNEKAQFNAGAQQDAKAAGTGLWTSCPGFGS